MATYAELFELRSNSDLRNKVAVAVAIKAAALLGLATPTAAQVAWAKDALAHPVESADDLFPYVLAVNAAATVAQITGATDAAIQANVNNAVDKILSV